MNMDSTPGIVFEEFDWLNHDFFSAKPAAASPNTAQNNVAKEKLVSETVHPIFSEQRSAAPEPSKKLSAEDVSVEFQESDWLNPEFFRPLPKPPNVSPYAAVTPKPAAALQNCTPDVADHVAKRNAPPTEPSLLEQFAAFYDKLGFAQSVTAIDLLCTLFSNWKICRIPMTTSQLIIALSEMRGDFNLLSSGPLLRPTLNNLNWRLILKPLDLQQDQSLILHQCFFDHCDSPALELFIHYIQMSSPKVDILFPILYQSKALKSSIRLHVGTGPFLTLTLSLAALCIIYRRYDLLRYYDNDDLAQDLQQPIQACVAGTNKLFNPLTPLELIRTHHDQGEVLRHWNNVPFEDDEPEEKLIRLHRDHASKKVCVSPKKAQREAAARRVDEDSLATLLA